MFRSVPVFLSLFALLFAWLSPCVDASDLIAACDASVQHLVCDDDSRGDSTGFPSETDSSNAGEEESDEYAKDIQWLIRPLSIKFYMAEAGSILPATFSYPDALFPVRERPPRA